MDIDIAKRIYTLIRDENYGKYNGQFYFEMAMFWGLSYKLKERPTKWLCDMAIWFPQYKELVGIELKDWAKPVPPSVIDHHALQYCQVFDRFYMAAPDFSKNTIDRFYKSNVGLIVMDKEYWLSSRPSLNRIYSEGHQDFLRRLDNNWHKHYNSLMTKYGDVFLPAEPGGEQKRLK